MRINLTEESATVLKRESAITTLTRNLQVSVRGAFRVKAGLTATMESDGIK
jgi:hypothetical protein